MNTLVEIRVVGAGPWPAAASQAAIFSPQAKGLPHKQADPLLAAKSNAFQCTGRAPAPGANRK
jgi:hypothetical protein